MNTKHQLNPTSYFRVAAAVASVMAAAASLNVRAALPFTPGNIVVFSADLASANNTTFTILELSPAANQGTPLSSVAISGTGATALRTSGSASSTGYLADSDDGSLVVFDAVNSTATSGNVNAIATRGVGTLNNAGAFALPTTYAAGVSGGTQARGATSVNNSTWYIADQDGVYTNGSSRLISANVRDVKSFGGTLYVLQASATAVVVSTLSADGKTLTALPGMAADATAQDFYLIASGNNGSSYDLLYVLTTAAIKKYSLSSGAWIANGSYAGISGFGLCAGTNSGGGMLYVTTGSGATAANKLVSVMDTAGYNSPITVTTANNLTNYTAAAGTTMKGVAFAPISTLTVNNIGTPAVGGIQIGATSVPVFGFQLTPTSGSANFTALKLTAAGTATPSDLGNFRVVYDADNSGTFNAGDTIISSSAQPLANPINFPITSQALTGASNYLVIADVAVGATVGHTFTGSIAAAGDVTTSVTPKGAAAGNQQTIVAAVYDLTMSAVASSESATISSLVNEATISTGSQGAQAWQVTFNNPPGNAAAATLSAVSFTQGVNNGVANWATSIQAAELFDGSSALAAGVISSTNIAFSGLSVVVGDNASKTLSLRIALKNTAGALKDHANFQFALAGSDVGLTGNGLTTASINSDQTLNVISVLATKLALLNLPSSVITNTTFSASVQAQDANGNLDLDDITSVTLSLAAGSGVLSGGTAQSLVNGTNRWSILSYDAAGIFTIQAVGGALTTATSANIVAAPLPTLTDVYVPQYIQGASSGNKRLPYAFRVAISNLVANATYRYYNQCVIATDSAATAGAGNCIFANPAGFIRTSGPSFSAAGTYGEFTSDATGSYTGWFVSEPTGNSRFATAGNQIFMRIALNDGAGGTTVSTRLTTTAFATVLAFNTTGANTGTGIRGDSNATDKNFVLLYDNIAGTGQPLMATLVENDGLAENTAASYVSFYDSFVDGTSGAWGGIIPNANANGVQRIEQRALSDGSLVAFNTDSDGIWPSGANTVNPSGGDVAPLVITATDDPLGGSAPPISYLAINSVSLSAANVIIGGTNAGAGAFYVLASTNVASPKVSWNSVATNIASGSGTFTLTNVTSLAIPQQFYLLSTTNNLP